MQQLRGPAPSPTSHLSQGCRPRPALCRATHAGLIPAPQGPVLSPPPAAPSQAACPRACVSGSNSGELGRSTWSRVAPCGSFTLALGKAGERRSLCQVDSPGAPSPGPSPAMQGTSGGRAALAEVTRGPGSLAEAVCTLRWPRCDTRDPSAYSESLSSLYIGYDLGREQVEELKNFPPTLPLPFSAKALPSRANPHARLGMVHLSPGVHSNTLLWTPCLGNAWKPTLFAYQ